MNAQTEKFLAMPRLSFRATREGVDDPIADSAGSNVEMRMKNEWLK